MRAAELGSFIRRAIIKDHKTIDDRKRFFQRAKYFDRSSFFIRSIPTIFGLLGRVILAAKLLPIGTFPYLHVFAKPREVQLMWVPEILGGRFRNFDSPYLTPLGGGVKLEMFVRKDGPLSVSNRPRSSTRSMMACGQKSSSLKELPPRRYRLVGGEDHGPLVAMAVAGKSMLAASVPYVR